MAQGLETIVYGLDLFSGIGGITRALEGYVTPVAYCENDRYAQAVLLSRMATRDLPRAPIWDDVRTLRGEMLPGVEIIYGGFPCQDISVAGRGAGLEGKRSGLFFEIARLVGELRPRFIFLENVPAIARRGGDAVVGTLADLGYDCRWDVLSAADVGANHLRERWWLLAHAARRGQSVCRRAPGDPGHSALGGQDVADAEGVAERAGFGSGGARESGEPRNSGRQINVADPARQRVEGDRAAGIEIAAVSAGEGLPRRDGAGAGAGHWAIEPNVGRVANGIPKRVDRLRGLGNAVVPAQAREAFERLMGLK